MKKLILIVLIINLFSMSASAYKFLGPKWPGKNPVVPYWFNEKGCEDVTDEWEYLHNCLLYTSPSPRDRQKSRMPSSA